MSEVRRAVGPSFPVGIRINSTDQREGGLTEVDAVVSGAVDMVGLGRAMALRAAEKKNYPILLAFPPVFGVAADGEYLDMHYPQRLEYGRKSGAISGHFFISEALNPRLADDWFSEESCDPDFPRFESAPPGGITAWYTMRLTAFYSFLVLQSKDDGENRHGLILIDSVRVVI